MRPSGGRPQAKIRFRGRSVALIAPRGPSLGTARILLDGRRVAEVDLSSAMPRGRHLVWARNFEQSRLRTLRVVSSEGHVIFGGVLVLR